MKNMSSVLIVFVAFWIFVISGCNNPEQQQQDQPNIVTSAYFSIDPINPEKSILPLPNILALNTTNTPPTLNLKSSMCFEPGSTTEQSLDELQDLNGFSTYTPGNIMAFFGRELDESSIEGKVVLVDLGTFGAGGVDARLDSPIPVSTMMTKTPKYLNGCDAEPAMIPTMIITPMNADTHLPVVLEGNHQYALAFLKGILDLNGDEVEPFYIFLMIRSEDEVDIPELLPVQAAYSPVLDAFGLMGIKREEIILASTFNTQYTDTALADISNRLGTFGDNVDGTQVTIPAATLPVPPLDARAFLGAIGLSCEAIGAPDPDGDGPMPACPGIGTFISGQFKSPNFQQEMDIALPYQPISGQPAKVPGRFSNSYSPALQGHKDISFLASTPNGQQGPYPVVIFQHPLTPKDPEEAASANKMSMMALSNALGANGIAMVAIDSVLAGDRQVMVKNTLTQGTELYSIINSDSMVTRDNIRQTVVDILQLVRVLKSCTADTCGGLNIDPDRIYFVGTSMGGVIGTLFATMSPDVKRVVLNNTGAGLVDTFASSPVLGPELASMLCLAGVITSDCCSAHDCSSSDLLSDPGFAQFRMVTQWMLDPADPVNYVNALASDITAGKKRVLVQQADGDMVFLNSSTSLLAGLLGLSPQGDDFKTYDPGACGNVPGGAHAMLLHNCGAGTVAMQTDLVMFLLAP